MNKIKEIYDETLKLPFVIGADDYVDGDDFFNIRIEDSNLTEAEYEFGRMYFTPTFEKELKRELNKIVEKVYGVLKDLIKLKVEHQDKNWFTVSLSIT